MSQTGATSIPNVSPTAVAVIPARYSSTRLPGKALLPIAGKPLVLWVAERALNARTVTRAIVATDDLRIAETVKAAGFEAVMTRGDHASGSDRVAEVAGSLKSEIIVNVQGDEPLIEPETIDRAVAALIADEAAQVATTWEPIDSAADVVSPAVVKVIIDANQNALCFSRAPIPWPRAAVQTHGNLEVALEVEPALLSIFKKHTGLYVYRREFLLEFTSWPQTELERIEALEQLRALERGVRIKVVQAAGASIGVDTAGDLERVRVMIENGLGVAI